MNWTKFNSALKSTATFLVVLFIALEFSSFILSKTNLLLVHDTPWAYRSKDNIFLPPLQWRTEESDWGAWHKPSSATRERHSCFDAPYYSNEVGARDDSFEHPKSKKRAVLIGDSFAEGFGARREETAQYLMEKLSGVEVFNFGSAGDLGPVQYSILYQELAKNYDPDELVIFFLPNNDFTDNDYDYWRKTNKTFKSDGSERWRPYYKKTKDGYESFIPEGATKTIEARNPNFGNRYLWAHNVYKTIKFILAQKREQKVQEALMAQGHIDISTYKGGYSGYFDATQEEQKAAVFYINKLIKESRANKIILVAIPTLGDLGRIAAGSNPKDMLWYQEFQAAGSKAGKPVKFIDLANFAPADPTKLFWTCDGHWSVYGNKWAAEIIGPYLQ
jgi:hypothetical protein